MNITRIGKISGGQDGAVFGSLLFRFDENGNGTVYDIRAINDESTPLGTFQLDPTGTLVPHANAVMFGTEYAECTDELPALYVNVYNNYADTDTPLKGVTCVYRVTREEESGIFSASLIQIIEVGFTEDASLWKVSETADGPRPYGNCAIDRERGKYYAFVMRDERLGTRYFAFDLPELAAGELDEKYGVPRVVLTAGDIEARFDCPYHLFVQGATLKNGKIYSLEGFGHDPSKPPAVRVIDLEKQREESYIRFAEHGLTREPELIDFAGDVCYYADNPGNIYIIDWKE